MIKTLSDFEMEIITKLLDHELKRDNSDVKTAINNTFTNYSIFAEQVATCMKGKRFCVAPLSRTTYIKRR